MTKLAGLVALAATLAVSQPSPAQVAQPSPSGGAALETIALRSNVYAIFGAGSNVVMLTGEDGIILVDSGTGAMADQVIAEVRKITRAPIRMIINTSADEDHLGGNERIARAGVNMTLSAINSGQEPAQVIAHENVLNRVSAPTGQKSEFPVAVWPTDTYISRTKSMYLNDEGIQIIHYPSAHSDGDSVVMFRRADVIVTGDIIDLRRFPVIDAARGGSLQGELDALNALIELAIPAMPLIYKEGRTLLVPGHGRISDQAEVVEYRDMVTVIRDRIQSMVAKGLTLDQVKAANPAQGYRTRYGSDAGAWTTNMFVEAVYRELTHQPRTL